MKDYVIFLLIGVLVGLGAALPFFGNEFRDFRSPAEPAPAHLFDQQGIVAPAEQKALYVSSSASDYDSTPSDGGGDTNPTTPTLGPGGLPTQPMNNPIKITNGATVGGVTAGVVVALALIVGIAIAVAVYIIKKKG